MNEDHLQNIHKGWQPGEGKGEERTTTLVEMARLHREGHQDRFRGYGLENRGLG